MACPNHELCECSLPQEVLDCNHGMCMNCAATFRHPLRFADGPAECAICLEVAARLVEHPASCGHYFCVGCTLDMHWRRRPVLATAFGCPPCPHATSCVERPCELEHWDCPVCYPGVCDCGDCAGCSGGPAAACPLSRGHAAWVADHPEQYNAWNDADNAAMYRWEQEREVTNSDKCPLCRGRTADSPDALWRASAT